MKASTRLRIAGDGDSAASLSARRSLSSRTWRSNPSRRPGCSPTPFGFAHTARTTGRVGWRRDGFDQWLPSYQPFRASRQTALRSCRRFLHPLYPFTINLLGQRRLFLGPLQKRSWAEPLRRLGRTAIDLAHHHVAVQIMHVDAQLDDQMGSRSALAIWGRCRGGRRNLAGARLGLDQRFGFGFDGGRGLLFRGLDSILAIVSLFYH